MSLAWASSFAGCYLVFLGRSPPRTSFSRGSGTSRFCRCRLARSRSLGRIFWQLINVFNSPAGLLLRWACSRPHSSPGVVFVGGWSLGGRWKGGLFLLMSPIVFALVASALHQYPFHGRLLLFLIPSVYLLVGEGAAVLGRRRAVQDAFVLGILVGSAYARCRVASIDPDKIAWSVRLSR